MWPLLCQGGTLKLLTPCYSISAPGFLVLPSSMQEFQDPTGTAGKPRTIGGSCFQSLSLSQVRRWSHSARVRVRASFGAGYLAHHTCGGISTWYQKAELINGRDRHLQLRLGNPASQGGLSTGE